MNLLRPSLRLPSRASLALRRGIYFIHLWFGLFVGLYFCMMGLTGSMVVFIHELEPMFRPELHKVAPPRTGAEPMSLSQLMAGLKKELPQAKEDELASLEPPHEAGGAYRLHLGGYEDMFGQRYVTIDPYTGKVINDTRVVSHPLGFSYLFHIYLLMGMKGFMYNGYLGIMVAFMVGSGVWLWWPRTVRQLKIRLSVKRGAGAGRVMRDLHNVFGIYSLPVLFLIVLTGASYAFYTPLLGVVQKFTNDSKEPEPKKFAVPAGGVAKRMPVEDLVRIVEAAEPKGAELVSITYPTKPEDPFSAYKMRGTTNFLNYAFYTIDPYRGTVLHVDDERQSGLGERIMITWVRFHFGWWGGWPTKILFSIMGLVPLGLYITGLYNWRVKRKAKLAAKKRDAEKFAQKVESQAEEKTLQPL